VKVRISTDGRLAYADDVNISHATFPRTKREAARGRLGCA
jgi:hypothetical protein